MKKVSYFITFILFAFLWSLPLLGQPKDDIEIKKITAALYCLTGSGGNMAVLDTADGLLLVDSKLEHKAELVLKKIREISPKPIRYLICTHYHDDHTGGLLTLGKGAEIIAQENCRASLVGREPKKAKIPFLNGIKTYDREMEITLGGQAIKLLHLNPAHTAGDTVVIFKHQQVIHTGDLFFNGLPPYIDLNDGADTSNWLSAIDVLSKVYADFTVIPGHGPVTDMKGFLEFAAYLKYMKTEVEKAFLAGKTAKEAMDEIKADRFPAIKDRDSFSSHKNVVFWLFQEFSAKKKAK